MRTSALMARNSGFFPIQRDACTSVRSFFIKFFTWPVFGLLFSPLFIHAQTATEMGVQGDFTVVGTTGTAADPNVEIKGFTVFGNTQGSYTGGVVGDGNVVVNGNLAVSSGAYFVGNSTFAANLYVASYSTFNTVGNIYIGGGGAVNNVWLCRKRILWRLCPT